MKKSRSRKVFDITNLTLMACLTLMTIYPIFNQLALSLSSTDAILNGKVTLFPIDFTLTTYRDIAKESLFWGNYINTIWYTIAGTVISLMLTTTCAYALSKKILLGRKVILSLIIFTMFFGGGLIPTFMLVKDLHLTDSIWAIIIPWVIVPYHILLMKTYFEGLPGDLEEAAYVDGLGQFSFFIKIVLPLSKPILATMTLFSAVLYWNDWFTALIYINDSAKYPVTLYLRNVMMGATMASQTGQTIDASVKSIPQGIQAASMMLVITPILCIYPFVQKHFVKGVMIGAIKG
ncbi:carbohydrate ABC transporter permease [Paenibacillus sp. Dod16]|uniref:carbohydrate ABC transporter permease n=1 Tax=Paenibacillus sp. Dod16 TaxID=3416392 RepID=UPI003CF60F82